MPKKHNSLLTSLSTGDLKRLLAARERIDVLEGERDQLLRNLAKVEKELAQLHAKGSVSTRRSSLAAGNKRGRKKTTRKKAAARKGQKRVKLEDVVVGVLTNNGSPMKVKDLYNVLVEGKLVKTKSKNFDNVLRRTLSTSKLVKRISRGVYGAA